MNEATAQGNRSMNKILFEVNIPGRVRIKKNGRRHIGHGKNVPSLLYVNWERLSAIYVLRAMKSFQENLPIKTRCRAEFEFHFRNGQNECDTSNCVEGPQDLLQKLGVIQNDKLIVEFTAKKILGSTECAIVRLIEIDAATQNEFFKKVGKK